MSLREDAVAWGAALAIFAFYTEAVAQSALKTVRVVSSAETVSMLTETPAGDYLIPNSQVFIGGKDGAGRWFALLGIAIDTARNQAAVGAAAESLQMKFDSTISQSLAGLPKSNVAFVFTSSESYDAKLLPSARFLAEDEKKVHLSFRLTARLKDELANKETTKNYHYGLPELRPFVGSGGWVENNAQVVREASKVAFDRLVEAFVQDVTGRFAEALLPDKRLVIKVTSIKGGPTSNVVLLGQTPQTIIVTPIFGDKLLYAIVQVIDRSTVRIDGLDK